MLLHADRAISTLGTHLKTIDHLNRWRRLLTAAEEAIMIATLFAEETIKFSEGLNHSGPHLFPGYYRAKLPKNPLNSPDLISLEIEKHRSEILSLQLESLSLHHSAVLQDYQSDLTSGSWSLQRVDQKDPKFNDKVLSLKLTQDLYDRNLGEAEDGANAQIIATPHHYTYAMRRDR